MLSDMMMNSRFDERAINQERGRSIFFALVSDTTFQLPWIYFWPCAQSFLSLLNSILSYPNVVSYSGVILRESEEIASTIEEVIHDNLHEAAFAKCGLGLTILGTDHNIRTLTQQDFKDFAATHYIAPNSIICAAGAVDHAHLCDLSEKYFEPLRQTPKFAPPVDKAIYQGGEMRTDVENPVAHIAVAFEVSCAL